MFVSDKLQHFSLEQPFLTYGAAFTMKNTIYKTYLQYTCIIQPKNQRYYLIENLLNFIISIRKRMKVWYELPPNSNIYLYFSSHFFVSFQSSFSVHQIYFLDRHRIFYKKVILFGILSLFIWFLYLFIRRSYKNSWEKMSLRKFLVFF